VIDLVDDEDAWEAINDLERDTGASARGGIATDKQDGPLWLPDGMDPVLEELPKWTLLAEILQEIEEEMIRQESLGLNRPARKSTFIAVNVVSAKVLTGLQSVEDQTQCLS
jgi:DNA excision repair protein ERCC-4